MAAGVGIFFDSNCTDEISEFPDYTNPKWRYDQFAGNDGESKDVQLWIKNTGDVNLDDVTITVTDSEGSDETSWEKLATTQGGLGSGTQSLNVGDLDVGDSTDFWVRCTVPGGTSPQTKYDLYLNVTAT